MLSNKFLNVEKYIVNCQINCTWWRWLIYQKKFNTYHIRSDSVVAYLVCPLARIEGHEWKRIFWELVLLRRLYHSDRAFLVSETSQPSCVYVFNVVICPCRQALEGSNKLMIIKLHDLSVFKTCNCFLFINIDFNFSFLGELWL